MREEEHNIQAACVRWFNIQWPQYRGLLFAVPNGGARSKATAGKLKAEGVVAGVADLILMKPHFRQGVYFSDMIPLDSYALCIEMKTAKGRQSPEQKEWQKKVEEFGYKYEVCRSLDEFMNTINNYLK